MDFEELSNKHRERSDLSIFLQNPSVLALRWPTDVIEQLLYDHASHPAFHEDYGRVSLETLHWSVERIPISTLAALPTGASEQRYLDSCALLHDHYTRVRSFGIHQGVELMWDVHGTWKRWPLLISRAILNGEPGLQIMEGRTRIGILRGRASEGHRVAPEHLAWVEGSHPAPPVS